RRVQRYIETDIIEVLPLAFVRGRTLDNAFIILDEAQNCTVSQTKTFLSRLGAHARLLVTGDITQIDLPPDKRSGLVDAQERLSGVPGIRFVWLTEEDIVRHPLVRRILDAYQQEPTAVSGETSDMEEPEDEGQ
ncbi:MAG: PhoH family protein, partial [Candidatus Brocadiia bacterium]